MAFCFYNLSSIFNGLVYFDQFSVLSKKQIILVLVGIVILLAGVWIVSFPPTGGYSIDIGAWTAAEDEDEEEESVPLLRSGQTSPAAESDSESSDDEEQQHDDEPLPRPSHSRRSRSEDIRLGAVAPDQAGALPNFQQHHRWITEPPAPVTPPSPSTPAPPRARRPRRESEAERSASMRRSRSTYGTASPPPTFSGGRRRRTTVAAPLSPPIPGATVHGQSALAGFSIGLSPVSPGFALVPTERRRRTILGVAGVGAPEGIRRVVSEGGAARSRDVERVMAGEGVRGREQGGREEERDRDREEGRREGEEEGEARRARGRWKLLGRVFAFTGSGAR